MLDRIIELMIGLTVAASAAVGGLGIAADATGTAATHAVIGADRAAAAMVRADAAATGRANASEAQAAAAAEATGTEQAAAAIEKAMELAPDAADTGLTNAWERVTSAPTGGAAADVAAGAAAGVAVDATAGVQVSIPIQLP